MIPERISHYQILQKLGAGGMGEVYLAKDTHLDRTVAIKTLPTEIASDPGRLHRFLREAKAASALKHPNVASIYELGEAGGVHFIVMEHVEGEPLDARIKHHSLTTAEILDIVVQVTDALEDAHSKGIVHRDIKPANIMITARGQVKVLDFGLAKVVQPASSDSKLETQSKTEPGLVLGTVPYMSPEQALGRQIDPRSDLFSLGVVMYQMTTGRLPFSGESATQIIQQICTATPEAIARFNYNVSPDWEHIIRRCLEKDPDRRYQTAHDLLIDLRNLKRDSESGTAVPTRVTPRQTLRVPRFLLPAIILAASVAVVIWFRIPKQEAPSQTPAGGQKRKMVVVLPFENLGSQEDQYFAAGITEEITSRLASVPYLGVISRTSAMQYRRAEKTIKQIGQELGVDFVLEGTVRWDRSAATGSRVRITPQLIRVSDDTHVWSQIYDRVIDDVFKVQSEIAENVISQLDIHLLEKQQKALLSSPTSNLQAYQAYLQGNALFNYPSTDPDRLQSALVSFQKAVRLDPNFALAYARLARIHLVTYHEGLDPSPARLAFAKQAVDQAIQLQPDLPAAYVALGFYHYYGFRDYERALEAFATASKSAPNNSEILESIGYVERRQGKFEESLKHFNQALELDPRNLWLPVEMAFVPCRLRRYAEADVLLDRSLSLIPDQVYGYAVKRLNILLWKGDLKQAHAILEKMPATEPSTWARSWSDQDILERNYEKALTHLASEPTEVFQEESSFLPKKLLTAQIYTWLNRPELARSDFQSAKTMLERAVKDRPKDSAVHSALGIAYAGLGQKQQAIHEGKLATELTPVSQDALTGPNYLIYLAQIYTMKGEYDSALDQVDYLLSIPSLFSVPLLKVDPMWDPLRNHPRYKAIVAKYGS